MLLFAWTEPDFQEVLGSSGGGLLTGSLEFLVPQAGAEEERVVLEAAARKEPLLPAGTATALEPSTGPNWGCRVPLPRGLVPRYRGVLAYSPTGPAQACPLARIKSLTDASGQGSPVSTRAHEKPVGG